MNDVDPMRTLTELATLERTGTPGAPPSLRAAVEALAPTPAVTRRNARRRVAGGLAIAALVGGASWGVVALVGRQPERPEQGPACRAGASLDSDIVALAPGTDPLTGCGALWEDGTLRSPQYPTGEIPPLAPCIGPGGVIEVFPGPPSVCGELRLDPADPNPDAATQAVIELTTRISDDINLGECTDARTVTAMLEALLADLALTEWTIDDGSLSQDSTCVKVEVDAMTRTLRLFSL